MLKARFLGMPGLAFGSESIIQMLSGRKLALFAYLSITRQPQTRSMLADLLWHQQSEKQAKSNLRYLLRDVRKVVGDYLTIDGQTIAFNQHLPHWIDVTTFASHLSPNQMPASTEAAPLILQELLDLYTGEFLAGIHIEDAPNFERWMLAQRRQLHDLAIFGLQLCTQQHLEAGEYETGLALNHYLLTLEPWREEAHRQRMILLAASGQRSAAVMQYEICCQTLEEELDVPPMNETTSLYMQIKSGQWFVGENAASQRNTLPVAVRAYPQTVSSQFTGASETADPPEQDLFAVRIDMGSMPDVDHFVGRRSELAALQRWINDENSQLVAVLGLGGQGKSALAARFVQEQAAPEPGTHGQEENGERSADGFTQIIWRSLNQQPTCTEVLQDWIQQLTDEPHKDLPVNFDQLVTTLFAELARKRCLLILDGAEATLQPESRDEQSQGETFGKLSGLFTQRDHRSCLLLTSRIRPPTLTQASKRNGTFRSLELSGLNLEEGEALLTALGLQAAPAIYRTLHQRCVGNPFLLIQAADLIHDLFEVDAAELSQEEFLGLGSTGKILKQQMAQLSPLEWQMMQLIATAEQPLSRQSLWKKLTPPPAKQYYYEALHNLQRAFWIQHEDGHIKLADLLSAYMAEQALAQSPSKPDAEGLVEEVCGLL